MPDLPLELGVSILNDLRRLGVRHVDFTGGEPLLYKHLPQLLHHAHDIGLFTSITTNGLLYQKRAKEISESLDSLGFSLNGPSADSHDKMMGVASFDKTIDAVKFAMDLGEAMHVHFTATNASAPYLEEMITFTRKLGAVLVVFPEFSYFGNSPLSEKYLSDLMRISRQPDVCVNTASIQFQMEGGNDVSHPTCTAGRSSLAVTPEGALMLPCFHSKKHEIPTNGKLYEVYTSPDVQRNLYLSGCYSFCQGCTNWCYINPSFAFRLDHYAVLYYLSTIKRTRAVLGRGWLRKMPGAIYKGLFRPTVLTHTD